MASFPDPDARRYPALHDPSVRVFLVLFTLAAIVVFAYDVEPLLTFRPVEAQVVGAGVAHLTLYGNRGHQHEAYQTDVFYRYEVAGTQYMGRQYRRADLDDSPTLARFRAQEFAAAGRVQAWYNPLHPEDAVLSRSLNIPLLIWTLLLASVPWLVALSPRSRGARPGAGSPATE